nr:hypothetical protein [Limosilactobacillus mucosae]
MKVIDFETVRSKAESMDPSIWYGWVDDALRNKADFVCPPKPRLSQADGDYFNVMPAMYENANIAMVKMIGRHANISKNDTPRSVMMGDMLIYEANSGILKAVMDAEYITTLRTGAVAAHSVLQFAKKNFETIGLLGLGNIMVVCFKTLLAKLDHRKLTVKLYRHHGQEERFVNIFKKEKNITFKFCDSYDSLMDGSDVIISAVTKATENFALDNHYKEGVTVVPICTMGFQNCDLFFDKVYTDEIEQIRGFKYFSKFKSLANVTDVLNGVKKGRESDRERILVYNYGLAIHDLYFAMKLLNNIDGKEVEYNFCTKKFFI